jgi:translation elongation factor EF-1alpha
MFFLSTSPTDSFVMYMRKDKSERGAREGGQTRMHLFLCATMACALYAVIHNLKNSIVASLLPGMK